MSMKKYFWKYLFRHFALTLLVIFVITVVSSALLNNYLLSAKGAIEQKLASIFTYRITTRDIYFFPPSSLTVKDICVYADDSPESATPIFIPKVKCRFSLLKFITKGELVIAQLDFDEPTIDFAFLKAHANDIITFIQSLTQKDSLKVEINKALLSVPQKGKLPQWVIIDSVFNLDQKQRIRSWGTINLEKFIDKVSLRQASLIPTITSLSYNFQGSLINSVWTIDDLEFKSPLYLLRLWGRLEDNVLAGNGSFTFAKLPNLNIHDLACLLRFDFPTIDIQNLSFSLEDIPLRLKGGISFAQPMTLNLKFSSFFNQSPKLRLENPRSFDLSTSGAWRKNKFSGRIKFDFLKSIENIKPFNKIEANVEDLSFLNTRDGKTKLSLKKGVLSYLLKDIAYDVPLKDFFSFFFLENEKIQIINFSSGIYDGALDGNGFIDMAQIPIRSLFDINVRNVSANNLHDLLSYCSKIDGDLSSQIHYQNLPLPELTGKVQITNGSMDDIIFFIWVSNFLKIPSLQEINFDTLSANFTLDHNAANIENIHLKSPDINFDGYFTLHATDFVKSKLSLQISKKLVRDSSKLRPLLRYLEKESAFIDFNFQLAGLFNAMNFKWLESDFKQTLQKILPSRMEKRLEITIEEIVETIMTQENSETENE